MIDHTKTPHVVQNSSALADVALTVRQSVTNDSKVSLLWPQSSISATLFVDLALLSAYYPLAVLQTKYTCRASGQLRFSARPSPDLLRPQESVPDRICTSCAAEALW